MGKLYIGLAILAIGGAVATIGFFMVNKIATLTEENTQITIERDLERGKNEAWQKADFQKRVRRSALTETNKNTIRETRVATTAVKEGLNDETHNAKSYASSANRAWAGSRHWVRGKSISDNIAGTN